MSATQCIGKPGLDIKHLVYMPVGHMVLKIYVPCKNVHVPSQYLYKPCKAYSYCWENKYMPRLKNHLPSRACNHKILCALGQDLHALGMRAPFNVEPWENLMSVPAGKRRNYNVMTSKRRCFDVIITWCVRWEPADPNKRKCFINFVCTHYSPISQRFFP